MLRDLASALKAIQDIYHRHGNETAYTTRQIGAVVNALLRAWPVKVLPLKSVKGASVRKKTGEHDPPISFFRDLLRNKELLPSESEWQYILLKHLRVVTISKAEDARLTKQSWKQNRPSNAYHRCQIRRDGPSKRIAGAHSKAAKERIAQLSGRRAIGRSNKGPVGIA